MADEVDSIDAKGESENAYFLGNDFGELGNSSDSSNNNKDQSPDAGKQKDSSPDGPDAKEKGQEAGGDKSGESEELPFHNHPRWQEVMSKLQVAEKTATEAENRANVLESQLRELSVSKGKPDVKDSQLPYQDVSVMEDEKLVDWFSEKPREFMANFFSQVLHEVKNVLSEENKQEKSKQSLESTYSQFEKDHSDFKTMMESGEIRRFMDTSPGHNPMSAYLVLSADKSKKDIQEQVNKAKEEGKQEALKQLRAKGNAATLGSGPAAPQKTHTEADELKDTKNKGGLVSALTEMLHRDRRALNG